MFKYLIATGLSLVCLNGVSSAQTSNDVQALYGNGVHAYFAGSQQKAFQLFSQVIATDSKDPRPYYFRAMTLGKMGRSEEAIADMQIGAAFEAEDIGNTYPVDRSLERVQGTWRKKLQQYRTLAKVQRLQQLKEEQRARYEETKRQESVVLRKHARLSVEELLGDAEPMDEPATEPASIAQPEMREPAPVAVDPPKASEEDNSDPFGAPASTPAVAEEKEAPAPDPFGDDSATVETPEAEVPATSSEEIVVGEKVKVKTLLGVLANALGTATKSALPIPDKIPNIQIPGMGGPPGMGPAPGMRPEAFPNNNAPGADPFGDAKPGNTPPAADPFGEPAMKPMADPFADDKPAAKASSAKEDPFGEPAKAAPSADEVEDPFGES